MPQTPLVGTHAYACVSTLSHATIILLPSCTFSSPQIKILYETLKLTNEVHALYTWYPARVSLMLTATGGFGSLVVLIKLIMRSGPQIKSTNAISITAPIKNLITRLWGSPRYRGEPWNNTKQKKEKNIFFKGSTIVRSIHIQLAMHLMDA